MNKRRLFASAMAACMLLSTMPSTALAADTENPNGQSISQNQDAGTNVTGPAAGGTQDGTINAGGNTEVENPNKLPVPGEDAPENYKYAVDRYNKLIDQVTWKALSGTVYYYGQAISDQDIISNNEYQTNLGKIKAYLDGITELDLSNAELTNVGAVAQLPNLKKLNISGNPSLNNESLGALIGLGLVELDLSGTGITDIGGLSGTDNTITENKITKTLTTLNISDTNVTKLESVWGDKDTTAETAAFPALKTLTAQNLKLTSISGLIENAFKAKEPIECDLTGSTLNGSENAVSYLITAVKYHQNLLADIENKDVKWNNLVLAVAYYNLANSDDNAKNDGYYKTTLENIGNIYARITELDMSNESLPAKWDLGALAAFTNLKKLNLSNADITDKKKEDGSMNYVLGALAGLTKLETLDVSGNPGITDLGGLAGLSALTDLDVSGATVDNKDFGALVGLKLNTLDLSGTAITDIGGLTEDNNKTDTKNVIAGTLTTLDISDTEVSKLESVWDKESKKAEFSALTTLTAHNLALDSISGLMNIAQAEGFNADDLTWNFEGSTLFSDPDDHIGNIQKKFGDNAKNFIPPEVTHKIDADVKPSVGGSEVTVPEGSDLNPEDFSDLAVDSKVLMDQAGAKAEEVSANAEIQEKAAEALTGIMGDSDSVFVHVQTYMDVQISDYQTAEGETAATLTLNITPVYKLIASTESNPNLINTSEEGKNAVVMKDDEGKVMGGELTITEPVTVTVPLPSDFVGDATELFVKHVKDNGSIYFYTATVENDVATFVNPNGFSDFVFSLNNEATAEINGIGYATLQDAVNAVENNGTITVLKSDSTAVTVNKAISFTVSAEEDITYTIQAGGNVNMAKSDVDGGVKYTFTAKPTTPSYSGGGSSSSSTPTYTVSVPTKVQNGSVSVSSKNPTKGSTVTLTVTPDKGYELATLTVTDKDGNKIALTDKGNGKFTFTMPASKVDIKATFVETVAAPEAPVNPFYDVAETDYFFDAVLWANENGITSGVGSGKFAPNATCTRAQMVTFLWNAAGCPNVEDSYASFTDVSANDYYYKAVLWAKANGITSGTGEGVFSPDQICNRAQMATFLYKFAEGKAVGSSNRFADVTASDYYAQPVQWAVENGITSGTGADTFGPNDPCTRAQMVTFLYRLLAD